MEISLVELKEIFAQNSAAQDGVPFKVGENYLIRTVTMIQTGKVAAITGGFLVLEQAAWIANTARFYDTLKSGDLDEVEPFPDGCFVAIASIVDAAPWKHALPTEQK